MSPRNATLYAYSRELLTVLRSSYIQRRVFDIYVCTTIYVVTSHDCKLHMATRNGGPYNHLKSSGYFPTHQVSYSEILCSVHRVHLCVLYGSQKKGRLYLYTPLTGFYDRDCDYCAVRAQYFHNIQNNFLPYRGLKVLSKEPFIFRHCINATF
jgi:hypothetical protein